MTFFWRYTFSLVGTVMVAVLTSQSMAGNQLLTEIADVAEAEARAGALQQGYQSIEVQVRTLDPRLRLESCDQPLTSFRNAASRVLGAVSIGVRCPGSSPWTLYVRTQVSSRVTLPVLSQSLARGAVLVRSDFELVERPISGSETDLVHDVQQLLGKELKRALPAGSPLRHNQVRAPQLVQRGQVVTLLAGKSGVEVRMQGKAMGNAAAGDRLLVSNLSSGRRVEGVVNKDGTVKIP